MVVALSLSLSLAILIIGLPVMIGSAYVMRWTAELDRQNAALVFGRPVRGHYRSHRGGSLGTRVVKTLRDPQVWRDLAWLITHSVVGFAFGVAAVTLVASTLGTAALPLWYWSVPGGVEFGLWSVDTLLSGFVQGAAAFYVSLHAPLDASPVELRPVYAWSDGADHLLSTMDAGLERYGFTRGDIAFYTPRRPPD